MTSYNSLTGELADLMRQAALDDGDMRPSARARRITLMENSIRPNLPEGSPIAHYSRPPIFIKYWL